MSGTLLQDEAEIDALAGVLRRDGVRSLLEVGSKYGGSLKRLAAALPVGSRVVGVDLPGGTRAWNESKVALNQTILDLKADGYDARVVWGDSTDPKVVELVSGLGPFDAIFIDANHTLSYVTKDWQTYGPMGRIVAFHDIAWRRAPEWIGIRIDVPQFWDSIKNQFRHEEFRFCPTGKNNGIGVLWREDAALAV